MELNKNDATPLSTSAVACKLKRSYITVFLSHQSTKKERQYQIISVLQGPPSHYVKQRHRSMVHMIYEQRCIFKVQLSTTVAIAVQDVIEQLSSICSLYCLRVYGSFCISPSGYAVHIFWLSESMCLLKQNQSKIIFIEHESHRKIILCIPQMPLARGK